MNAPEIIREANELARTFYALHDYEAPEGYRFDKAHHPQERMMWHLAAAAYEALRSTYLDDVLSEADE